MKELITNYVKSYTSSKRINHDANININKSIVQNYGMVIEQQINSMIESVTERWRFYSQRSKNLIDKIVKG